MDRVSGPEGQSPFLRVCSRYVAGFSVLWLAFGNLNNGANAGLSYLNGNNALTNGNWNYLARLSKQLSKFILRLHILSAEKIESKSSRLVHRESR